MTSASTPVGSGPSDSGNSRNSPGPMRVPGFAVQVTVRTASVIVPSSVVTGGLSGALATFAVQPATGVMRTPVIGWSAGRVTSSLTVPAVSDSLGTRSDTTL